MDSCEHFLGRNQNNGETKYMFNTLSLWQFIIGTNATPLYDSKSIEPCHKCGDFCVWFITLFVSSFQSTNGLTATFVWKIESASNFQTLLRTLKGIVLLMMMNNLGYYHKQELTTHTQVQTTDNKSYDKRVTQKPVIWLAWHSKINQIHRKRVNIYLVQTWFHFSIVCTISIYCVNAQLRTVTFMWHNRIHCISVDTQFSARHCKKKAQPFDVMIWNDAFELNQYQTHTNTICYVVFRRSFAVEFPTSIPFFFSSFAISHGVSMLTFVLMSNASFRIVCLLC